MYAINAKSGTKVKRKQRIIVNNTTKKVRLNLKIILKPK